MVKCTYDVGTEVTKPFGIAARSCAIASASASSMCPS
jgi:hypothetical protein